MRLTGKAKENFERWFYSESAIVQMYGDCISTSFNRGIDWFEALPESMQWGVYQDFLDAFSIHMWIEPSQYFTGSYAVLYGSKVKRILPADMDNLTTRDEARKLAIEAINLTLNGELPTVTQYPKEQYSSIDHIYDTILDKDVDFGHEEEFTYDGKHYHAKVQHDGTYMEYGIKGREVIFNVILHECGTCGDDTTKLGFCPKCDTDAYSY
tara:strand:- start:1786 stop:2415 length:630 start_codon:yes stop_codon:yes gene_type:complete